MPSLMTQLTNTMQQGGSPMNVQTPGSPMYDPSLIAQSPSPMPNQSPASMMHLNDYFQKSGQQMPQQLQQPISPQPGGGQEITLPVEDQNAQQAGTQVPLSEVEIILKAMEGHLKHKNKMEAKVLDAALPVPQPQPATQQI